jgi:UDP-N-acetylglucosamine--N-acetylmuramyl-(pentapeptide) pyrophosphoryl-undecaprenol N-acetylglucosamine transferase
LGKIVLAGGGTGGHVYPALAIGDELRERGHEVLYYGDANRLEGRVAPLRGYDFRAVKALQYPRSGLIGKIRFGFGLLRSTFATMLMLRADQVDVVLGVGGYISAPPVLAAWLSRRGRAIHEANVVPGLANKLCARVAQRILLTYEKTRTRIGGKAPCEVVGVPVNPAILSGDRVVSATKYGLDAQRPCVVFVGGSLGAQRINELAIACARSPGQAFQVLHLCGRRYVDEVNETLGTVPTGMALVDYEDRMGDAYAMADLVVCRSGSATLAELTAVGLPSLLIPSPNVTENHQEENARGLEACGAARVLVEKDWDIDEAVGEVTRMLVDMEGLVVMAAASKQQAKLNAASRAADIVESLLG